MLVAIKRIAKMPSVPEMYGAAMRKAICQSCLIAIILLGTIPSFIRIILEFHICYNRAFETLPMNENADAIFLHYSGNVSAVF